MSGEGRIETIVSRWAAVDALQGRRKYKFLVPHLNPKNSPRFLNRVVIFVYGLWTPPKRKENMLKHFKTFYLKAKAGLWPCLSYLCRVYSKTSCSNLRIRTLGGVQGTPSQGHIYEKNVVYEKNVFTDVFTDVFKDVTLHRLKSTD